MTVVMDLGDFIPEEYRLSFTLNGRAYAFDYAEAAVDEVLRMIAEEDVTGAQVIDRRRKIVTTFLLRHVSEGDPKSLEEDLKLVPYASQRGSLDVCTIYDVLMGRIKKNDSGGSPVTIAARPGSPATSPS